jgi:hypothetical protein
MTESITSITSPNLLSAQVLTLYVNVLQFSLTIFNEGLAMLSFGLQTHITPNTLKVLPAKLEELHHERICPDFL